MPGNTSVFVRTMWSYCRYTHRLLAMPGEARRRLNTSLGGAGAPSEASDSFWVAPADRYPNRRIAPGAAVDARDMVPLTGLVVKSLITTPVAGTSFAPGKIAIGGFAWAGESDIAKVDISIDNGATWAPTRLVGEQAKYTWRRFEHTFTVSTPQSVLVLSRATDSKGNAQPAVSQWNPSGYLWNQYDSVRVEVKGA